MGRGADLLLEREAEMALLDAGLSDARAGSGSVVLVQGPAGIGKSRLLGAAGTRAADSGTRVLRARGGELERDFAFGVARQLFEPALAALGPVERGAALQGAAALAAPVVELDVDRGGRADGGDRLFAVMHGLYWLCANLASEHPLVIAVDDVQWADEQSVRWLAYLARRLADVPALVVLAARVDESTPASSSLAAIAAEPLTRTLQPRPLSVSAVGALVADVTGVQPSPEVARACHERSAGNPFVLRELSSALVESGIAADRPEAAEGVAGVLPGTVARSVLARLDRLPKPAVSLARAVAVLGTDVHLIDAARLADLDEETAADTMDVLAEAGLLLPGTPLRFVHPLMREAIYEDLPTGRRLYQHRRAADVLAARTAPERIAAHLLQCEPKGDRDSVAILRLSGARAFERGAPETAVRYLLRALEEEPDAEIRGDLLRELGVAEARVGRPEAVEHLEQALALASTTSEIGATTRELSIALGALGRMPDAVEALERGIQSLSGRDRELELRLEGELGAFGQLDVGSTPRVGERLHRVAGGLAGETPGERLVLASYAHLRSNELAPAEELSDLAERALGDGLLLQDQTADSAVFYLLIYVFFRAERYDLSDRWLAEAVEEARARGSLLGTSIALAVRAQLRWLRGELVDAEADAHTSMDGQVEAGWASVLPLAVAVRADCLLERGEADAAVRLFEDAGLGGPLPELQMYRWAQAARGRARVAAGRADDGIADLLDCQREEMGARASITLEWRADAALALAARGDVAAAQRLAEEQLALAREAGVARPLGVGLRTLGLLSSGDEGRSLLAEAVTVLEGSSARLEHARALVELGSSVRRAGQRAAAREHLRAGYEMARACGSTVVLERASEELAASGVRLRRPALAGRDALTPSERRVAEMAATGMSNPEIAQALFVTRKTIEMHLGNVYRKLEVAGREQLPDALVAREREAATNGGRSG
jgi:DNA-binding CsgD family transcriptional regulator